MQRGFKIFICDPNFKNFPVCEGVSINWDEMRNIYKTLKIMVSGRLKLIDNMEKE